MREAGGGDTVRLSSGTYREGGLTIPARVRLEAGADQEVVISGAEQVQDWDHKGSVWVSHKQLVRFCQKCTKNPDPHYDGVKGYPEQVYLDGEPLRQVASREEVTEGTFYVEPLPVRTSGGGLGRSVEVVGSRTAQYVLGSDPTGHDVEVVQHSRALTVTGDGASVAGLTIEKFAPTQMWDVDDPGAGQSVAGTMVMVKGDDVRVEDSVLRQSTSGSAIHFSGGSGQSLAFSRVVDNAGTGLEGNRTYGLRVLGSYFTNNNTAGHDTSSACGEYCFIADTKITHSEGVRYERNTVDYSASPTDASAVETYQQDRRPGVWFDEGVVDSTIVGNYFVNTPVAVFNEVSSNTVIASNLVNGAGTGIYSSGSDHARIWNNTIAYALEPVLLREDPRTEACKARGSDGSCTLPDAWSTEHGLEWAQTDTEVFNNIFTSKQTDVSAEQSWRFGWHVGVDAGQNWDGSWVAGSQMVRGLDYNVYYRQDSQDGRKNVPVLWEPDSERSLRPKSLEGLTNDPAVDVPEREQNGWDLVGPRGGNPLLVKEAQDPRDYSGSDFRLKEGSEAKRSGKRLTGEVAQALGVQEGAVVDRGALFNVAWDE